MRGDADIAGKMWPSSCCIADYDVYVRCLCHVWQAVPSCFYKCPSSMSGYVWLAVAYMSYVWLSTCPMFAYVWLPVPFCHLSFKRVCRAASKGQGTNAAAVSLDRNVFYAFQRSRYRRVLNGLGTNPAAVSLFRMRWAQLFSMHSKARR